MLFAAGCATADLETTAGSAPSPATRPAAVSSRAELEPVDWSAVDRALGRRGEMRDGVYVVRVPRDDLAVSVEGMDIPAAAGLESTFWFYRCSCGKPAVIGQFTVTDYEANDVVYSLQKQDILISAISPMLLYDQPRLMLVRFQSEGDPATLAQAIRSALDWTGKARMAPAIPASRLK